MSSELRSKKLRGSGGYVIATIDDDLQRKGNLGGPDLFLAPIGRIDNEKISKYYCNTCERDFEGAPQIQFENPNEEVAENLILIEKGQYICTNCNSTLAEYREFKKPDEILEVGNAKPVIPPGFGQEPLPTASTTVTMPDYDVQSMPPPPVQEEIITQSQQVSSSFNSIAGMSVYDGNAKKIGTVKQVGVDNTQNVLLVITKNDGSETAVKWNQIKKIGEIIILGESGTVAGISQADSKCPSCGFANKTGSKFCESCGTKIQ
jgi:sporulation protein YlmC with PRC-barrel domain